MCALIAPDGRSAIAQRRYPSAHAGTAAGNQQREDNRHRALISAAGAIAGAVKNVIHQSRQLFERGSKVVTTSSSLPDRHPAGSVALWNGSRRKCSGNGAEAALFCSSRYCAAAPGCCLLFLHQLLWRRSTATCVIICQIRRISQTSYLSRSKPVATACFGTASTLRLVLSSIRLNRDYRPG